MVASIYSKLLTVTPEGWRHRQKNHSWCSSVSQGMVTFSPALTIIARSGSIPEKSGEVLRARTESASTRGTSSASSIF